MHAVHPSAHATRCEFKGIFVACELFSQVLSGDNMDKVLEVARIDSQVEDCLERKQTNYCPGSFEQVFLCVPTTLSLQNLSFGPLAFERD